MTIRASTVRNFGILVLLGAVCALVYLHFFRPEKPARVVEVPPIQPAFQRLSALIDAHIGNIFSPLDGQVPPIPHQELRVLRENFADSLSKESARAQPIYQTAVQLCDALLLAIQERERALASLADTRSKAYGVALSQNKKKEEEEKRQFFEVGVARRWADNLKAHRERVVNLYSRLRAQEREFTANMDSSGTSEQVGNTIVLKHPTSVRLRYGTATLPAGLSLRIVRRTKFDVIVEYAGEHVAIPQP
jgi:hypothetical protein